MYSIVLLAAMTTGGESADLGWRRGGCGGCHGGCYGGGYGGCHGGCWGNYSYGGCHGYHPAYYGCWGSAYGGCNGYGYGGWGAGCWGTPYGGYGPGWAGYSCYGGCGGYASVAYGAPPVVVSPGEPMPPADGREKLKKKGKEGSEEGEVSLGRRARLIVKLPSNAKLYIDDQPVKAAKQKTFQTPELSDDKDYFYEVRVVVMKGTEPVIAKKRVIVRAGEVTRADFSQVGRTTGVAKAR